MAATPIARRRFKVQALTLAFFIGWSAHPAAAFTEKEMRQIFNVLDVENNGKVTRTDFELNKMVAFYRHRNPDDAGQMKPLSFDETGLSREAFDKADQGHKGYLDGLDVIDAIRFDYIDRAKRGYFDYADLTAFLTKIGRQQ